MPERAVRLSFCRRARFPLGRFARAEAGQAALQFALVATPFLAMLLASLQLFLLFFAQQYLETAAETTSRSIMTGSVQKTSMTQAAFKQALCQNTKLLLSCTNLMVDVQVASDFAGAATGTPALTYDGRGAVSNSWSWNPGSPGNIVVLRVMYLWPVIGVPGLSLVNQRNGTHLIMAVAVFKNESYN